MEKEFKYRLGDRATIDRVINDPLLDGSVDRAMVEDIDMHAVYFDTENEDLRRAGIAYRIRRENDRMTATIKWDNDVDRGLHSREELNLVITDERFAKAPNIDAFESSYAYDVLYKAAGDRKLVKQVEMDFTRRWLKIDTGRSISALAFDEGVIHGKYCDADIMEMEIELYHGDEKDFRDISCKLAEKHGLRAEERSKLQRGFMTKEELAEGETEECKHRETEENMEFNF